jgi:hypothetical protein
MKAKESSCRGFLQVVTGGDPPSTVSAFGNLPALRWLVPLPQTNAGSAAVLIDKFDAGRPQYLFDQR